MLEVFLDPLRLTLYAAQLACGDLDQLHLGARRRQLRHRLLELCVGNARPKVPNSRCGSGWSELQAGLNSA